MGLGACWLSYREGLSPLGICAKGLKKGKVSPFSCLERSVLIRRISKCKGPEAGAFLSCSQNSKGDTVAGVK